MAQKTFDAQGIEHITLQHIDGDLEVYANNNNQIVVELDDDVVETIQDGGHLLIRHLSDDCSLSLPASVELNLLHAQSVEINGIDRIVVSHLQGDLKVSQAQLVQAVGDIQGDLSADNVAELQVEQVQGDVTLRNVVKAHYVNVSGDLAAKELSGELNFTSLGGDLALSGNGEAKLAFISIGGDCTVRGVQHFQGQSVGGDLEVRDLHGDFSLGSLGGDLIARELDGPLSLRNIGGDAIVKNADSALNLENIGGDLIIKDQRVSLKGARVGGDFSFQGELQLDTPATMHISGDASFDVSDESNLTLRATVGGDVTGPFGTSSQRGHNQLEVNFGEGGPVLELFIGGDLALGRSKVSDVKRNIGAEWNKMGTDWAAFGREMGDLGRELGKLGQTIGREVSEALSELGVQAGTEISEELKRKIRQETEKMEAKLRKAEEKARRSQEHAYKAEVHADRAANRINVRINEREWRIDPERIERIKEQARRAAEEGLTGALQSVERALGRIVPTPPTPPTPSTSATPPTPPAAPNAPTPPTPPTPPNDARIHVEVEPATGDTVRIEPQSAAQTSSPAERVHDQETILRMVAEGRITPEEGDLLIESLNQ